MGHRQGASWSVGITDGSDGRARPRPRPEPTRRARNRAATPVSRGWAAKQAGPRTLLWPEAREGRRRAEASGQGPTTAESKAGLRKDRPPRKPPPKPRRPERRRPNGPAKADTHHERPAGEEPRRGPCRPRSPPRSRPPKPMRRSPLGNEEGRVEPHGPQEGPFFQRRRTARFRSAIASA